MNKILKIITYAIPYLLIASLAFGLGIVYGEVLLISLAEHALSYTNIEVNFNMNETKLVDYTMQKFNETILPQLQPPYDINYNETYQEEVSKQ